MSKQDIEKRLGFAAQGVKETIRTSAKAEMGFLSRVGYAATALTPAARRRAAATPFA